MQQHLKQFICLLLGALMLMSALSGCARTETPESDRFMLRAAVCGCIGSLDPAMNTDERAESVFHAIYENLMRTGNDPETDLLTAVPGVAKEYTETVNADGTVDYAFTLRSSARWSDGTRVRSHDFVYAWRRLVDPATESPNHAFLSMVQGYDDVRETGDTSHLAVKAEGESVFRVTLSAACPYFLTEVCTAVATMPLRSDSVRQDADWSRTNSVLCDGPYQVGVWIWEDYIQLRRNLSYYDGGVTGPDTLRFVFAADGEARRLYDEGQVDFAFVPPGGGKTGAVTLRSTVCVLYNHMSEAFASEHVRRAFDQALDCAALAAEADAFPATAFVPSGVTDRPDQPELDFHAAGGTLRDVGPEGYAMRCLDAVNELRTGGYWGGVGFPELSCLYPEDDPASAAAAASAAAMWQDKLNVLVHADGLPREEYETRLAEGTYDLAIGTFTLRCGDALTFLEPLSSANGDNVLRYVSTPFDLLIGAASMSHDVAARSALLHDAEALMLENVALSPLYFASKGYLLREGFENVRYDRCGNAFFSAVRLTAPEA